VKIRSKEAKFGDWIVVIICIFVILLCVMPMINLLAQSLSSSDAVINGRVTFLPVINRGNITANQTPLHGHEDYDTHEGSFSLAYDEESYAYEGSFTYDDSHYSDYVYSDEEEYVYTDEDYSYSDDLLASEYGELAGSENYDEWYSAREATKDNFRLGITMEQYRYVFMDPSFTWSMWWTAILTVICTLVSLTMTVLCAYPLTYDWLKGKLFINTVIIFTMYFSAGTIPNYILMKDLGLLNNPLVLIIPNCLSVFNMIILRSFFFGIPDSLRESAEIDGANPFTVLIKIYLPLSAPVLATLALFYAVGRWNGFTDALLYINAAPQWVPIQLKLWQLIQNMTSIDVTTVEMVAGSIPRASDAIKAAAIMFATVPILIVYPWLQRYFIAGVTIGAVKG
jgi:putative aldouronate transport system permease protein